MLPKPPLLPTVVEQKSTCAACLKFKATPLRVDNMGGYVCLTCVNAKLDELFDFKEDVENATLGALDETCHNEKHCGCVPLLRNQIKQMQQHIDDLLLQQARHVKDG